MTQFESSCSADQIQGSRGYQEDAFAYLNGGELPSSGGERALLVLADGMGGHVAGAIASRTVVQAIIETYGKGQGLVTDRLRDALGAANDAIATRVDAEPELDGMGSTAVAAVASGDGLEWISVGDSPMWLYRNGVMRRLNADHSMAPVFARLVKIGQMTAEEAAIDRQRNALRSAITGEEIELVDVSSQPVGLESGDIVVLASDGVETLNTEEIAAVLSRADESGLDAAVSEILRTVEGAGNANQDNATLMLYSPFGLSANPDVRVEGNEARSEASTLVLPRKARRGRRLLLWGLVLTVGVLALYLALGLLSQ